MDIAEDIKDGGLLKRHFYATPPSKNGHKQPFSSLTDFDAVESEEEDLEYGDGADLLSGNISFPPLYMVSNRTEIESLTKRLSVSIILPSGVSARNFSSTS